MSEDDLKIKLSFNGDEREIKADKYVSIGDILSGYTEQIDQKIENLYFVYNGDLVKLEKKFDDICGKNKELNILVFEYETENNEGELKISKDIICPICKEICMISIKDYKITLNKCKNGHKISNILFEELQNFQSINEAEILCQKCNNNKNETTDNKFYKCLSCNINLCPICQIKHNKNKEKKHFILDYDLKNYFCNEHSERYILYCENCNKDLCDICEYHNNHKCSFHFKNIKTIKIKRDDLRIKIDTLKNELSTNIQNNNLNKIINNLELYYNIYDNIANNFDKKEKNIYSVMNIKNINDFNETIFNDIGKIIGENNIDNKNNNISNIFEKMRIKSEFILKYNVKKNGKLRIFGEPFVKKNNKSFIIIINQKNYELSSFLHIIIQKNKEKLEINDKKNKKDFEKNDIESEEDLEISDKSGDDLEINDKEIDENKKIIIKENEDLEIHLKQTKNIKDISYMFANCTSLKSVQDLNWNNENIINMTGIFNDCQSLVSLPDLSKWNTNNVTTMNNIFSGCESLKSIPDISIWNTSNVTDISGLFNNCKNLIELPDISIWKTDNINKMNDLFNGCESL